MKRKSIVTSLKIGLTLAIILSVFAVLVIGVNAGADAPKAAKINNFSASSTSIKNGDTVTLNWNVSNADSIEILGLEKTPEEGLPLKGSLEVWPETSTSYVLIAYSAAGDASKTITVNVDAIGSVKIDEFKASSLEVNDGDSVILSWKTSNAKSISITGLEKGEEGNFPLSGSIEVWPTQNTSYVLQAVGVNGDLASQTVTVNIAVPKPVIINSFKVDSAEITEGSEVLLSWSVDNAEKISIKDVKSGLEATGSLKVAPKATTTYTLEAIAKNGEVKTAAVNVKVNAKPSVKITKFVANASNISRGELVTLSWTTENAVDCKIVSSDGKTIKNRPANGSITVTPNASRTYKLIATDAKGTTAEKEVIISVN